MSHKTHLITAMTVVSAVFVVLMLFSGLQENPSASVLHNGERHISVKGAAPFPGEKTSFNVVIRGWSERGVSLYLPTWLPPSLKPTVAWVKIIDGEVGGSAIFLYSGKGIDRIETAELTIEIYPAEGLPFDPETSKGNFTEIDGWKTYYDEQASVGHEEYRELYGSYARLISVYIDGLNYFFRGAPSLTIEDMIKIVEGMEPAESRAALLPHIVSQILFVVMCIVIGACAFLIHRSARRGMSTSMWLRDEGGPFHIEDWGYHHRYREERRKKENRREC